MKTTQILICGICMTLSSFVFANGCDKSNLVQAGEMTSQGGGATIRFIQNSMIITQFAGSNSIEQTSEYTANGNSITYRIVEAMGNGRPTPIKNAGPHTVPCSLSGGTMRFGSGTWSAW
ncbi:MAG: hypothetical protein JJ956_08685 [Pseudomonadales bacterium]|nr:hypothetical protein [Pseudomonadales bacterium]